MMKCEVAKAMKSAGIFGVLTGKGDAWEVELPDVASMREFVNTVCRVGGYRTGHGSYVLRPVYTVDESDYCSTTSKHHY